MTEHHSAREATLQALADRGQPTADTQAIDAVAGDLLPVPSLAHPLDTVDDSALLRTVAVVLDESEFATFATGYRSIYSWPEDWE